jgi:hypothetical protein
MRSVPVGSAAACASPSKASSACCRTFRQRAWNVRPASVGWTRRVVRISSVVPTSPRHLLADDRLGDAQPLGSPGEGAGVDHRGEIGQPVQVHAWFMAKAILLSSDGIHYVYFVGLQYAFHLCHLPEIEAAREMRSSEFGIHKPQETSMFTRRAIMKTTLAAGAAAVFAPAGLGHAAAGLSWKHFPAGETASFGPRC